MGKKQAFAGALLCPGMGCLRTKPTRQQNSAGGREDATCKKIALFSIVVEQQNIQRRVWRQGIVQQKKVAFAFLLRSSSRVQKKEAAKKIVQHFILCGSTAVQRCVALFAVLYQVS